MPILNFSFDTGTVPLNRIVTAVASSNGYQATLPDGTTNPQTAAQFAKECVRQYVMRTVRDYERQQAHITAEATVTDVTLT